MVVSNGKMEAPEMANGRVEEREKESVGRNEKEEEAGLCFNKLFLFNR